MTIIITILGLAGMVTGSVHVGLPAAEIASGALTMDEIIAIGAIIAIPILIVASTEIRYRRLRYQTLFED